MRRPQVMLTWVDINTSVARAWTGSVRIQPRILLISRYHVCVCMHQSLSSRVYIIPSLETGPDRSTHLPTEHGSKQYHALAGDM